MSAATTEKPNKRSRATACERCKLRKQRCDQKLPICTNCQKAGAKCIQPEKYRCNFVEKDSYTAMLESRLQALEAKIRLQEAAGYQFARYNSVVEATHTLNQKDEPPLDPARVSALNLPKPQQTTQTHSQHLKSQQSSPYSHHNPLQLHQPQPYVSHPSSGIPTTTASSSPVSSRSSPRRRNSCGLVSILNSDPTDDSSVPPSFSVVSSLLKDSFLGRAKDASNSESSPASSNLSEPDLESGKVLPNITNIINDIGQPKSRFNMLKSHFNSILDSSNTGKPQSPTQQQTQQHLQQPQSSNTPGASSSPYSSALFSPATLPPSSYSFSSTPGATTSTSSSSLAHELPPEDDINGYLLPLDIDVSEFLVFDPAPPPDEALGKKICDFLRLKNHMRLPVSRIYDFSALHKNRFIIPDNPADPQWRFEQFYLNITYTLVVLSILGVYSANNIPTSRLTLDPYSFFYTAISHARRCRTKDPFKQVICLTMCSLFLVRQDMARNLHWQMMDKAMQIAQANNFHKKESLEGLSLLDQENRLRVFWSLYQMDRLLAFERRKPYVIPEAEIDIPLFADIDDDEVDEAVILAARKADYIPPKSTSFSLSLHGLRIIRIEAEIIDSIYRVDKTYKEQFPKVEPFLKRLDDWKVQCPRYMGHGQIIMEMHHARAVRLLLQPFLGFLEPTSPLFIRCMRQSGQIAQGCTEICRVIKGFNLMSANVLFMSGLTLIYGLWLASKSSLNYQYIIEDIRLCTCCLYALAERSSIFAHYRDTVDNLASATIRHVSELASKRYVVMSNLPDSQSGVDTIVFNEESGNGSDNKKPLAESTLLSPSAKICSKSGVLNTSDNVRYPIPITTSQNVNGKIVPSLQGSSDEETHTIFRLQQQLNKDSHEKFKRLQELKRKRSEGSLDGESNNGGTNQAESETHTNKYMRSSLNNKTASEKSHENDENHQLIAELVNSLQPPHLPQTPGAGGLGESSSATTPAAVGQASVPPVPSLGNRFASGGSSVSWWNNLEQRLHVSESPRNWVNALGSHDGVTTWIHDLSAFAKQHLNSGSGGNSKCGGGLTTADGLLIGPNPNDSSNKQADILHTSGGNKDNNVSHSTLNELLYGHSHGNTLQQQHHFPSTPGSGVSQAPSPLNFLAAASEYAAAGGLEKGSVKNGSGLGGEGGATCETTPRKEEKGRGTADDGLRAADAAGAGGGSAGSGKSLGGAGGDVGRVKTEGEKERSGENKGAGDGSGAAVAPITISIASSLGDLYAATTVPAMEPVGIPGTPDDGQQMMGSGGEGHVHGAETTAAGGVGPAGDEKERGTEANSAGAGGGPNGNGSNFAMYDGSLPAVGSGGTMIEEYGDWAYDANLFYYNDLVTWSL